MCGAGLYAIRATHINEDDAEWTVGRCSLLQIVLVWVVVEPRPDQKIISGKLCRKIRQWDSVSDGAPGGTVQRNVASRSNQLHAHHLAFFGDGKFNHHHTLF